MVPLGRRIGLLLRGRATPLLVVTAAVGVGHGSLVALAERPGGVVDALHAALAILAVSFSVILVAGVVSREVVRGMIELWLQKPIGAVGFYLVRFLEATGAALGLVVLSAGSAALLAGLLRADAGADVLAILPTVALVSVVTASVVFGFSAWCARGDPLLPLGFLIVGAFVEGEMPVLASGLGPTWTWILWTTLVPGSALREISAFMAGGTDVIWAPGARIVGYAAAWVAVGALGVRRITK